MKRTLLFSVLLVIGLSAALAQSVINGRRASKYRTYDPKDRPPVSLPEAYPIALVRLGPATNRFHCVYASVSELSNSNGWTGWTFWFSNTNGERGRVIVFFDRGALLDVPGHPLSHIILSPPNP